MIGVGNPADNGDEALKRYPDRFIPSASADPNDGHGRHPQRSCAPTRRGASGRSACSRPAPSRRSPSTTRRCTRIYAKCVELGIPVFCCAGVPGPRLKFAVQHVELIDEVMYDFPELVFVTRHGCEPWTDLAVKLMLKWPGLHYSTQRLRPEVLPEGDHRLRQHPGRRQGHLRRLLPDGPVDRADHDRDAERRVQGRRVAQVPPRQRPAGPRTRQVGQADPSLR